jgi:hypothetical protein
MLEQIFYGIIHFRSSKHQRNDLLEMPKTYKTCVEGIPITCRRSRPERRSRVERVWIRMRRRLHYYVWLLNNNLAYFHSPVPSWRGDDAPPLRSIRPDLGHTLKLLKKFSAKSLVCLTLPFRAQTHSTNGFMPVARTSKHR